VKFFKISVSRQCFLKKHAPATTSILYAITFRLVFRHCDPHPCEDLLLVSSSAAGRVTVLLIRDRDDDDDEDDEDDDDDDDDDDGGGPLGRPTKTGGGPLSRLTKFGGGPLSRLTRIGGGLPGRPTKTGGGPLSRLTKSGSVFSRGKDPRRKNMNRRKNLLQLGNHVWISFCPIKFVLNPLTTAQAHILARTFLAINRQPLELESCSNPPRIQQVF